MYIRAIEAYLTERMARKLWIQGKLADGVYKELQLDWLFYVKAAKLKASMPTLDQAEALKNQILRLTQRPNQANWDYAALSNPEKIYTGRNRRYRNPII